MAMAMGLGSAEVCRRSSYPAVRAFLPWLLAATGLAAAVAALLGAWHWRASLPQAQDLITIPRQWLWFLWPAWPLALWTLWRWRHYLMQPAPVGAPGGRGLRAAGQSGDGRVRPCADARPARSGHAGRLRAADPASAAHRQPSTGSRCSSSPAPRCTIWVHVQPRCRLGVPAKPAANIAKPRTRLRSPVFSRSNWLLAAALLGTLAWLWLLRWRTGRHREARVEEPGAAGRRRGALLAAEPAAGRRIGSPCAAQGACVAAPPACLPH
jgi:hypothetical protein